MLLSNISAADLRRAADLRERIDVLQAELSKILGTAPNGVQLSQSAAPRKKDRRLRKRSPALKARLSAIAKARWKKVKASGRNAL
jgi:hypothetical protein